MYYKLRNINLINNSRKSERFNILSEVVDSGISFENPVIVDSVEELELWFGRSFSEYDFFSMLLRSGVSLYLYKPIKSPKSSFISNFIETDTIDVSLPLYVLPERGEKECLYILKNKNMYIWKGVRWIQVDSKISFTYKATNIHGETKETVIDLTKYRQITSASTTKEKICTLDQIEQATYPVERIGKIFVLSDGSRYIWYEWIRLDDLKLIPGFDETEYDTLTVNVLPTITDETREELGKHIYQSGGIKYVLYGDSTWMNADYIPQTVENTSESLQNRDTLYITSPEKAIPFTYPKYDAREKKLLLGSEISTNLPELKNITQTEDINSIIEKRKTYAFEISFPRYPEEGSYLVLPNTENVKYLIVYGTNDSIQEVRKEVPKDYIPDDRVVLFSSSATISAEKAFYGVLKDALGYTIVGNLIISPKPVDVLDYYSFNRLSISSSIETSLQYINRSLVRSKNDIEVWSRCIGKDSDPYDDTQNIIFTIEEGTLDGYYRVIIEKYGYSEVFEAPVIIGSTGNTSLETKINTESKLVRCNIKSEKIRTGTYILRGGTYESTENPEMFTTSLDKMFNTEETTVFPDFLLVPNIRCYGDSIDESGHFKVLDVFSDISKEFRCQVLIQNNIYSLEELEEIPNSGKENTTYKIGDRYFIYKNNRFIETTSEKDILPATQGGDFVFNLLENDNRLVYFYSDFYWGSGRYPLYSVFLDEFFSGEYNKFVSERVIYSNISSDPYELGDLENTLIRYKSNYLTYNGHEYYFKKYLSGESYNYSILRQFILGKIYRELMKLSRSLISMRLEKDIRSEITSTINKITESSSAISSIEIKNCDLDLQKNKLVLKLESSLKELVEEDILLDITINYNENGNSIAISQSE